MEPFGYEKLEVWKEGMRLAKLVYAATSAFPNEELFGMTSQLRRSAVSVPSNIAEGYGQGQGNFGRHLQVAIGSVFEMRTHIQLAIDLKFGDAELLNSLLDEYCRLGRMLHGLSKSRQTTGNGGQQTASR